MPHYNLTILTSKSINPSLVQKLKERYNVLLVDKKSQYRNRIKTEDGYIVILNKEKKNIEISTEMLIRIDS